MKKRLTVQQVGALKIVFENAIRCANEMPANEVTDKWLTTRPILFDIVPASVAREHNVGENYSRTLASLVKRGLLYKQNGLHGLTLAGMKTIRAAD